jgi:hypothetical protein
MKQTTKQKAVPSQYRFFSQKIGRIVSQDMTDNFLVLTCAPKADLQF